MFGLSPAAGVLVAVAAGGGVGGGVGVVPLLPAGGGGAVPGLADEQMSPRSVSGFAVLMFTAPWLHTVMARFFGFVGSGSTNVAQKSSVTPRTMCISSSESK